MRYLWNLAKLFPAALPPVGAWRRPHRRAKDGGEVAQDGVVLCCVGTTQKRVFRRLISRAMPEILSVARAIWSRQRAITAGLHGSISLCGHGRPATVRQPPMDREARGEHGRHRAPDDEATALQRGALTPGNTRQS
jgi:hypothetical protein